MKKYFVYLSTFQFHKGTIRTVVSLSQNEDVYTFQFHKGTIRTFNERMVDKMNDISIP